MSNLVPTPWQALLDHCATLKGVHLRDLFLSDADRFSRFSVRVGDLLVDYSKQRVDAKALRLLVALAEQADLRGWRARLFAGEKINASVGRAVLHPALRYLGNHQTWQRRQVPVCTAENDRPGTRSRQIGTVS